MRGVQLGLVMLGGLQFWGLAQACVRKCVLDIHF
jgi:hypothetical protein